MPSIKVEFDYEWTPFMYNGSKYSFSTQRFYEAKCDQSGSFIYRWKGQLSKGPHKGKTGVLIGETTNIIRRIGDYKSKTQESGNLFWRKKFLSCGTIYLYLLKLKNFSLNGNCLSDNQVMGSKSLRLVIEQSLVGHERSLNGSNSKFWIVNKD